MSPSENENDTKKTDVQPEPLCLFCFPEDTSFIGKGQTYVNTLPRETDVGLNAGKEEYRKKSKDGGKEKELWSKRRTEVRIRRRRIKEPIKNLKSYLLTSVRNEKVPPKVYLPSLFEVLETVKDAWPSPPSTNFTFFRHKDETEKEPQKTTSTQPKKKNPEINFQFSSDLLNRRLSMPEVLMRKYSTSKEKTSEESETNKTAIDISPSSSSAVETARRKDVDMAETEVKEPQAEQQKKTATKTDACQQTSDSDDGKLKTSDLPKRVTQNDYYKQGKRIIKVKAVDNGRCTCQRERESSTTASAKEETDESGTTESVPSSSPVQLPKCESSSGNLSSESDNVRCTCAELSSKETSTDLYFSGKSTLSQTVSDKSISTQDSTVSINSVSTRGSTVSDNSNSTTPEVEKTSAKETTTSPDYSPRTPRNRKNRRKDKRLVNYQDHSKDCPRYSEVKHSKNYLPVNSSKRCPLHSENVPEKSQTSANIYTNSDQLRDLTTRTIQTNETVESGQNRDINKLLQAEDKIISEPSEEQYKWAKLSQEELYMMQQLRHRKFVESQRKFSNPLPPTPNSDSLTACNTGSAYKETECIDQQILIPRYSALPRTLSMLVNTSSPDTSHNSDSDNQSLADSLEDQPVTHVHKLYFDTKKESKPVRGDVSFVPENKLKRRQPRGRAFFVSIKDPYGEDEMLEKIEKIPQPPEKIKNQIFERHLNLCTKHKHLHHSEEPKGRNESSQKKRKTRNKSEENEKTPKIKKKPKEENKKVDRKSLSEGIKRTKDHQPKAEQPDEEVKSKKEIKDAKAQFSSKIPVLVSSRSTSSSPERSEKDSEAKEKSERPKTRLRHERQKKEFEKVGNPSKQTEIETTQILEITHSGAELSLQKPQAVIHPSQLPFESKAESHLTMPPLVSTPKISPFRQSWSKQLLTPARRSPIGKFRQRFEVIPEEKSSSLSSAEEKNGKESLSKFADASTSPLPFEKLQFHNYNIKEVPNLIVAKITKQQLETLPYVKHNINDNQKIIFLPPESQNSNSSKGRNALIAMNREDFSRLARGWMSFYKLNENLENSENEEKTNDTKDKKEEVDVRNSSKSHTKSRNQTKTGRTGKSHASPDQKEIPCISEPETVENDLKLNDDIRFDCSNTILRNVKSLPPDDSEQGIKKQNSLPELRLSSQRTSETRKSTSSGSLPKVGKQTDDDDLDSDSTDYMEPPSPRVPPLPIDDFPSDATLSSSDNELSIPKPQTKVQSFRYLQFKKRGTTSKTRMKRENSSEASRFGKKKNSGWSVTVAGTLELSQSAPDLEMRLSFPASGGPPTVSQSDSGFAEDSNYSKLSESLQDLDSYASKKELPLGSGTSKQKWTVTVKNPKQGEGQGIPNNSNQLPVLECLRNRNPKKVLKDVQVDEKVKRLVERKMRAVWPKMQRIIKREFLTESGRLITECEEGSDEEYCLTVKGSAISLERKQKSLTMTERDITRRYTRRAHDQQTFE